MTSGWRLEARRAIQRAIAQLPENCDRTEVKKAIDAAYPFGQRAYHPYKIWLDERRDALEELGIIARKPPRPRQQRQTKKGKCDNSTSPGQLSLFD